MEFIFGILALCAVAYLLATYKPKRKKVDAELILREEWRGPEGG